MQNEQKIRAILFYLSVLIFLIGLPFILSSVLGYKFNRRTLKFTRTGLVVLKTQPSGANIYLDGNLLSGATPITISDLLPGEHHLRVELDRHYPWESLVSLEAGKATRLEKIILFPIRPNIRKVNKEKFSLFWIDEDKAAIYYATQDFSIFKSDLDGNNTEKIADFIEIDPYPSKFILSPDRKKIAYFNKSQIGVTNLDPYLERPFVISQFTLSFPLTRITNLFWHSDSYHLILVTNRSIEVLEAKPQAKLITLVNLNTRNTYCFYDLHSDAFYFIDSQEAPDGNTYDNLYRLDLNIGNFNLQQLIKLQSREKE